QFETVARPAFGQNADEFVPHPLSRNGADLRMQALDGFQGTGFDLKIQSRREPDRTQQPKVIFPEARFRVADGSHEALLQIGAPMDEIEYLSRLRVHQQAVDRKIPAQYVLPRIGFE